MDKSIVVALLLFCYSRLANALCDTTLHTPICAHFPPPDISRVCFPLNHPYIIDHIVSSVYSDRLPDLYQEFVDESLPQIQEDYYNSFEVIPWIAIAQNMLSEGLNQWGFVFVRTTYKSQDKWDNFTTFMRSNALEKIDLDVFSYLKWTFLEDPKLEGADITTAAGIFSEWVETKGRDEVKGSVYETRDNRRSWFAPRYRYFVHVDEETLEGANNPPKTGELNGKLTIGALYTIEEAVGDVSNEELLMFDTDHRATFGREREIEDEDTDYLFKKFKPGDMIGLYARLTDPNRWQFLKKTGGVFGF